MERPAWTLERIEQLIRDRVPEDSGLDYKGSESLDFRGSSPKNKHELARDVSAFANAGGGVIIYGVAESPRSVPHNLDGGVDPAEITRERLEQIIHDNLRPSFGGVTPHLIELQNGRLAVVIEVAQSTALAPHQAPDNIYYQRVGSRNVPMADFQIRDVMNRGSVPDIRCLVQPVPTLEEPGILFPPGQPLRFDCKVWLDNRALEPAEAAELRFCVDTRLYPPSGPLESCSLGGTKYRLVTSSYYLAKGSDSTMMANRGAGELPLFRGRPWIALDWKAVIDPSESYADTDFLITWEVLAPKMPRTAGYYLWKLRDRRLTEESFFTGLDSVLSNK